MSRYLYHYEHALLVSADGGNNSVSKNLSHHPKFGTMFLETPRNIKEHSSKHKEYKIREKG